MTPTSSATRGKTGERCQTSGVYRFDGYTDGSSYPTPEPGEREIALSVPNVFPPIRSSGKGCWWLLTRAT